MDQIPPARRVIRLFPDYSRTYPLWETSTPTWDVGYTTTPETYGLSKELGVDLAGWQAFFETHCNPFEGWDTVENWRQWLRDGEGLTQRLRAEVEHFADVEPEFGPHRRKRRTFTDRRTAVRASARVTQSSSRSLRGPSE